jgi:subtilisin family serine protease
MGAHGDDSHSASGFRNEGECVDIFAVGEHVHSAHNRSDSDCATPSGASMATPAVAGLVARLPAEGVGVAEVKEVLLRRARKVDILDMLDKTTPNLVARL